MGLTGSFDGIVSCNYSAPNFSCKPEKSFFDEAIIAAGQSDLSRIYFVDDSALNCKAASSIVGWGKVALFDELGGEQAKLEKAEENEDTEKTNLDILNGDRKQGIALDIIKDMSGQFGQSIPSFAQFSNTSFRLQI